MFDLRTLEAADAALATLSKGCPESAGQRHVRQDQGLDQAFTAKPAACPHLARLDGGRRPL
jgi:hypothetical protein